MQAELENSSNDRNTVAYNERSAEDLQEVVQDLEPAESNSDVESIIQVLDRLDGELRDSVGLTNHFTAPIRSLNNPETTFVKKEGEKLQLAGEEFGQIGQELEEYADIQNIQYWLAAEPGTFDEETRNSDGEHLAFEDATWSTEQIAERIEGFKLVVDGEEYSPEEAGELIDALNIRSSNNLVANLDAPEHILKYQNKEEVLENDSYKSDEEFQNELQIAKEADLVTNENNLTLKGVLQTSEIEAKDLRSLNNFLSGEESIESFRMHSNQFFQSNGDVESAPVTLEYTIQNSLLDTLYQASEQSRIDYEENQVEGSINDLADLAQQELESNLQLMEGFNYEETINLTKFLNDKLGIDLPEKGKITLSEFETRLETNYDDESQESPLNLDLLSQTDYDSLNLDVNGSDVKEAILEAGLRHGDQAELESINLDINELKISGDLPSDTEETVEKIEESLEVENLESLFETNLKDNRFTVETKSDLLNYMNVYSGGVKYRNAFKDDNNEFQEVYSSEEFSKLAELNIAEFKLLSYETNTKSDVIWVDDHVYGNDLQDTIEELDEIEGVEGKHTSDFGQIQFTPDSQEEFIRARNILERLPDNAYTFDFEDKVKVENEKVRQLYDISVLPEHAEEVMDELNRYLDTLEDENLLNKYGAIKREGPSYEALPNFEQGYKSQINEKIDFLIEEKNNKFAKKLRKIFPDTEVEEYQETGPVLEGRRNNYPATDFSDKEPDIPQELEDKIFDLYQEGKVEFETETEFYGKNMSVPTPTGSIRINYDKVENELLEEMGELEQEGLIDIDAPLYAIEYDDQKLETIEIQADYEAKINEIALELSNEQVEIEASNQIEGPVQYSPNNMIREKVAQPLNPVSKSKDYGNIEIPTEFEI